MSAIVSRLVPTRHPLQPFKLKERGVAFHVFILILLIIV